MPKKGRGGKSWRVGKGPRPKHSAKLKATTGDQGRDVRNKNEFINDEAEVSSDHMASGDEMEKMGDVGVDLAGFILPDNDCQDSEPPLRPHLAGTDAERKAVYRQESKTRKKVYSSPRIKPGFRYKFVGSGEKKRMGQRYARNKSAVKERRRSRYAENPSPVKKGERARYADNPSPVKKARRSRYAENPSPVKKAEKTKYWLNQYVRLLLSPGKAAYKRDGQKWAKDDSEFNKNLDQYGRGRKNFGKRRRSAIRRIFLGSPKGNKEAETILRARAGRLRYLRMLELAEKGTWKEKWAAKKQGKKETGAHFSIIARNSAIYRRQQKIRRLRFLQIVMKESGLKTSGLIDEDGKELVAEGSTDAETAAIRKEYDEKVQLKKYEIDLLVTKCELKKAEVTSKFYKAMFNENLKYTAMKESVITKQLAREDGHKEEVIREIWQQKRRVKKTTDTYVTSEPFPNMIARGGTKDRTVKLSKTLSWILRHGAKEVEVELSAEGFVSVFDLLKLKQLKGFTEGDVRNVVESNDKQRFSLEKDPASGALLIRANQGHTLAIANLELQEITDSINYPLVLHGTYSSCWPQIKLQGLSRMKRQHIHFAPGFPEQNTVISGMRTTCDILIFIDLPNALKDGFKFYESTNHVILTSGNSNGFLPPKYFKSVMQKDRRTGTMKEVCIT